jgi:sodium/potassium/calcium exchanger 6
LFLLIRQLDYVCDNYISEAISKLSLYMKLSESLAGSTLVSFSNGASDVVTALVAAGSQDDDNLVMGSIFGAALFTMTVAFGIIIIYSQRGVIEDVRKVKMPIVCSTFLVAIAVIVLLGFVSMPYFYLGLLLLGIYIVYIVVLEREERKVKRLVLRSLSNRLLEVEAKEEHDDEDKDMIASLQNKIETISKPKGAESFGMEEDPYMQILQNPEDRRVTGAKLVMKKIFHNVAATWEERGVFMKAVYLVEIPCRLAIRLTIPPVNKGVTLKVKKYMYAFTVPAFILYNLELYGANVSVGSNQIPVPLIAVLLSLVFCFIIYYMGDGSWKASPRWLFMAFTLVSGIYWLDFIVNVIIDIISYIQIYTNASDLYLGMVLLGIGNSSIDTLVDYTLAKKGFEVMAITGVFCGQMFNLVVGFALSCLTRGVKDFSRIYKLFSLSSVLNTKDEFMVLLIILITGLVLLGLLAATPLMGYTYKRPFGWVNIIGYCLIFALFTGLEIGWKNE